MYYWECHNPSRMKSFFAVLTTMQKKADKCEGRIVSLNKKRNTLLNNTKATILFEVDRLLAVNSIANMEGVLETSFRSL